MQKKLLAVAVLSAFSGVAAAQSANVTLYGNIITHIEQTSATGGDSSTTLVGSSTRNTGTAGVGGGRIAVATVANGAPTAADQANRMRFNPAGSHFGLRGTEDLGNGLSAWFQIELSANFGANPSLGGSNEGRAPTMRNTAVGLRSNTWGTALFGVWDTPFNSAINNTMNANTRIGGASTSHAANLLGGNPFAQGAVSGQATASWCTNAASAMIASNAGATQVTGVAAGAGGLGPTAAGCANFGMNFDRRERSSIQWWSPSWNGFEVRAAYNVTQDGGSPTTNGQAFGRNALKQNIWDLSVAYTNGPLVVGYAYERQNDTLATAVRTFTTVSGIGSGEANTATGLSGAWTTGTVAGSAAVNFPAAGVIVPGGSFMSGSTGVGHRLGGKYAFSNGIGIGAAWESLKWDMSYGVDAGAAALAQQLLSGLKKTAWRLQGNYTTGSHFVSLDYTRANAVTGSIISATTAVANTFDGSASGARAWMANYNYAMSKRTSIGAYYNTIKNETNANYSGIVFAGIATPPGGTAKYLGMQLRHSF